MIVCTECNSVSNFSLRRILKFQSEWDIMDLLTFEFCIEIQQNKMQEMPSFLNPHSILIFFCVLGNYFF